MKFFKKILLISLFSIGSYLLTLPLVVRANTCSTCEGYFTSCLTDSDDPVACDAARQVCLDQCSYTTTSSPSAAPADSCTCSVRVTGPDCQVSRFNNPYTAAQSKSPREIIGEGGSLGPTCPAPATYPAENANDRWAMSPDKCEGHTYDKTNADGYKFSIVCVKKVQDLGPALDPRDRPEGYEDGDRTGIAGILPRCAFYASGCDGTNANINLFIEIAINIGKVIFSIIGMVAFVMFVYGGFTMIMAFGSAEKFKKGQGILVAAVIGLLISFSAYLIVQFVLGALQVGSDFRIF